MKLLNKKVLEKNIEEIAEFDLTENNIFGCSYIVCQNDEVICKKHFGYADFHKKIPVCDNTIFRLASMTKPVTAIAILMLIDRGIISLDTPVKTILPQFNDIHCINENGIDLGVVKTDVTVMHLLTHTSGVGGIKSHNMSVEDKKSIENTINYFVNAGLDFEPFTKQAYSGFASFDVLVAIIEKLTGVDYEEFLQNEIFVPCNMKDTTFIPTESQCKRIITMHNKIEGKNGISNTTEGCVFEDFPYNHKLGGAGLVSTLADYSNFAQMLLNKGLTSEKRIISEEIFKLLCTPHVPYDIMPAYERWGLGVRVITEDKYEVLPVGTYGWSGAYGSHFWVDPENKITAVYMKNSRFDGGSGNKSACRFEKAVHNAF